MDRVQKPCGGEVADLGLAVQRVLEHAAVVQVFAQRVRAILRERRGDEHRVTPGIRLCADIDERVNAFLSRPLEGAWPYLWLDATYVKVREGGRIVSRAVIVAVAVNEDGKREVLGVTTGPSEAETCLGPSSCVRWPTAACGA